MMRIVEARKRLKTHLGTSSWMVRTRQDGRYIYQGGIGAMKLSADCYSPEQCLHNTLLYAEISKKRAL